MNYTITSAASYPSQASFDVSVSALHWGKIAANGYSQSLYPIQGAEYQPVRTSATERKLITLKSP